MIKRIITNGYIHDIKVRDAIEKLQKKGFDVWEVERVQKAGFFGIKEDVSDIKYDALPNENPIGFKK